MSKVVFTKNYERDTTFSIQGFFAECLLGANNAGVGAGNPHTPLYLHYFDGTNVQFYENKPGMQWFYDELLKKNLASSDFLESIVADQRLALVELKKFWQKGSLETAQWQAYLQLARRAMQNLTLYFLSGMDERTPQHLRDLTVELRKEDEFGSEHDAFIRRAFAARGYPAECANVLLAQELIDTPVQDMLDARMKGAVLVDGKEVFVGSLADYAAGHPEFEFENLLQADALPLSEVRGQIAQKGTAVGKVRVVKNRAQANMVEAGEVIVSPMTTPDFIVGMHKAAAFVTDEGGIVCHAAIVAREMKKPCVIGTKLATQVFKDGDLVEVDANEGVVRIVKRYD